MSNQVVTNCQNCIFAEYQLKEQTGCAAGQLELHDKIAAYNEDGLFYIIPDICSYFRPKEWAGGEKDMMKLKDRVIKDSEIKYSAFVYAVDKTDSEIEQTLNSLLDQGVLPSKLILCLSNLTEDRLNLLKPILMKFRGWQIESLLATESRVDYFYRSVVHHKKPWFLLVEGGCIIKKDWIRESNMSVINGKSSVCKFSFPEKNPQVLFAPTRLMFLVVEELEEMFNGQ